MLRQLQCTLSAVALPPVQRQRAPPLKKYTDEAPDTVKKVFLAGAALLHPPEPPDEEPPDKEPPDEEPPDEEPPDEEPAGFITVKARVIGLQFPDLKVTR